MRINIRRNKNTKKNINKIKGGALIAFEPNLELLKQYYKPSKEDEINIEFIKKTTRFNSVSNNNNNLSKKEDIFNKNVIDLVLDYNNFNILLNNNYNKGLKSIKKVKDSIKVLIDLHGEVLNNIFQLPKNINIVFLSSVNYSNCFEFDSIKDKLNLYFNEYLDNPYCFEDKEIKKIFNESLIYYGGQYCIDLIMSRENQDIVSGINLFSNSLSQSIDYNSGDLEINLSNLLLSGKFNSSINYTILISACRRVSIKIDKSVKYSLVFYEQVIKQLNFKIFYDNNENKDKNSLNNFYKKCESFASVFNITKSEIKQRQFINSTKKNNKYHPISRRKTIINDETEINFIYKGITYTSIYDIKLFISEYLNMHNKNDIFNKLRLKLIFDDLKEYKISTYDKNIIDIIILIFNLNYTLIYEYLIFCQYFIDYNNCVLLEYFKNKISEEEFYSIDISNINVNLSLTILICISKYFDVKQLKYLYMDNTQIDDKDAKTISDFLSNTANLIKLYINNNDISDIGVIYLAEALKTNESLQTLDISNNHIQDTGALALVDALEVNKTLLVLRINDNFISDDAIQKLKIVAKENIELETAGNRIFI